MERKPTFMDHQVERGWTDERFIYPCGILEYSEVEFPFWAALASQKVEKDRLNDTARRLVGAYEIRRNDARDASCRIQIHNDALTSQNTPPAYYQAEGVIRNVNTIEEFRDLNKNEVLTTAGLQILKAIDDGSILLNPALLVAFVVICFADIKKYQFTYLFGFPALNTAAVWKVQPGLLAGTIEDGVIDRAEDGPYQLSQAATDSICRSLDEWRQQTKVDQYGFFLAHRRQDKASFRQSDSKSNGHLWEIASLKEFETGFFSGVDEHKQFFGFADPSPSREAPAWLLRNLLTLLSRRWNLRRVQMISYRGILANDPGIEMVVYPLEMSVDESKSPSSVEHLRLIRTTGWERNHAGKVVSKMINIQDYLDPTRLADQAVDLNLKLMRWRIAPNLDLEKIKNAKCLLLGAGTLGCYVSRGLLGWGVRRITFVDYGKISYSNPVRQSLFKHSDCLGGGLPKAHQAAKALREIYPGVDSEGHVLSIPMAGHPVTDEEKTRADFDALKQLIFDHDAIFQLMDSRESRWLPTLMGKSSGKIVMNAALGFDSFLAMRHGCRDPRSPGQELGCYFCNDVVAPIDSLSGRTLDQQCTVTRPGLAAIASGSLVEIFVNVLQHPQGKLAPADASPQSSGSDPGFSTVPHQLRGFLSTFQTLNIHGKAYNKCSACSDNILRAYEDDPWGFVKRALNEKGFVEELSGLAEVQRAAEKALIEMDLLQGSDGEDASEGEVV